MTDSEYLQLLVAENKLTDKSPEIVVLRARRYEVAAVLSAGLADAAPSIRYGGSKAKDTMVRVSYDLDMTCYLPSNDPRSLEAIYDEVKSILDAEGYRTLEKTSAIRIHGDDHADFHVDVVPGRFFDESRTDVWLHRTQGTKEWLKTNLDVHIDYVRDSGLQDSICLMKLWRHRFALDAFRTFALELITIKLLGDRKGKHLDAQLRHVFEELLECVDRVAIKDPANANNDLSGLLDMSVRAQLKAAAKQTLDAVTRGGWEKIFGPLRKAETAKQSALAAAVAATTARTKPWLPG